MTTSEMRYDSKVNVRLTTPRRQGKALCNQIVSIDKSRLSGYMCTLSETEMNQIDAALCNVLGLPFGRGDERTIEDMRVEVDLYRKLYEKTMDKLVQIKMESDSVQQLKAVAKPEPKPETKSKPEPELEPKPAPKVDVNSCTEADLQKVGFQSDVASAIVERRPYRSLSDILNVPGVTKIMYRLAENKLRCIVHGEKVNVNTATVDEIVQATGMGKQTAERIRAYVRKNGPLGRLEDLLNVDRFGNGCMKKYGCFMEVK